MSPAFEEIVMSIDPAKHEMKWSLTLGLPPDATTGNGIWWDIHLQFITWQQKLYGEIIGPRQGITFYNRQHELGELNEIPESDVPRAVIDRCIEFFENED